MTQNFIVSVLQNLYGHKLVLTIIFVVTNCVLTNYTAETGAPELSERKCLGEKYNFLSGSFKLRVTTKCDMTFLTIDTSNNTLMLAHAQTARNSSQQCQFLQTLSGPGLP